MQDTIYHHTDPDNDRVGIFRAEIKGDGYDLGRGINIRTDPDGSSIPDAEIPELIQALQDHLREKG